MGELTGQSPGFLDFRQQTLELPVRDGLHGSAIPEGRFEIHLFPSPKFMRLSDPWVMRYAKLMPHLLEVPKRTDIMVHWGNNAEDIEGCVAVGMTASLNFIGESRLAFSRLYAMMVGADVQARKVFITVRNSF